MSYTTVKRGSWLDCYEQVGVGPILTTRGRVTMVPVSLMRLLVSLGHYDEFVKSAKNRPTQRLFVRRSGEATIAKCAKAWAATEKKQHAQN